MFNPQTAASLSDVKTLASRKGPFNNDTNSATSFTSSVQLPLSHAPTRLETDVRGVRPPCPRVQFTEGARRHHSQVKKCCDSFSTP